MTDHTHTTHTEAANAALIFSTTQGMSMNYQTHNETTIDTGGSGYIGNVDAGYDELCDLFGAPSGGDGYKVDAQWRVRFEDGTVASIYNYKDGINYNGQNGVPVEKIRDWHVGGVKESAHRRVQIAIDLYREGKQEKKPKSKVEEAMTPAIDMMETIAKTKGKKYAQLVEIAINVRKQQDLLHMLIGAAISADQIPEIAGEVISKINAHMMARVLGLSARIGDMEASATDGAEEVIGWADRIMEAEGKAGASLIKDILKKDKDD